MKQPHEARGKIFLVFVYRIEAHTNARQHKMSFASHATLNWRFQIRRWKVTTHRSFRLKPWGALTGLVKPITPPRRRRLHADQLAPPHESSCGIPEKIIKIQREQRTSNTPGQNMEQSNPPSAALTCQWSVCSNFLPFPITLKKSGITLHGPMKVHCPLNRHLEDGHGMCH